MLSARAVEGPFRNLRVGANVVLIAVLFAIPWIRIAGDPLVLLDIPGRRFHVFGLTIVPQELYFLWILIALAGIALFFFTALAGRLWCGWACPQTVFTDLFAGIARRIQGWTGPRPPNRIAWWRKALTHGVWFLLSAIVAFHVVGYFVSPYELLPRLRGGEHAGASFSFLTVMTVLCYLDFAIVKQTFCKYLCPYARFQGVLFDRDSLVIGYDTERGEPRGKKGRTEGDCVDCGLCVQVCPTEIDIRDGLQMECITCTQCIDACNGVMKRLGREPDLIAYRALSTLEEGRPARLVRPRVVVYGALLVLLTLSFGAALATRVPMSLTVAHNREALFGRAADGRYGNAFTLRLENRDQNEHRYALRIESDVVEFDLVAGQNPIPVAAGETVEARVFVMAPAGFQPEVPRTPLRFFLEPEDQTASPLTRATHFLTPANPSKGESSDAS